jgi:hypothetical protein
MKRPRRFSTRQILRACRCREHPLIRQMRHEPSQQKCIHALSDFLHVNSDALPQGLGLLTPLTIY